VTLVRTDVLLKRRFLQEPHDVSSQKTAFLKDMSSFYREMLRAAKIKKIKKERKKKVMYFQSAFLLAYWTFYKARHEITA
jgi:hypothetical protein